jgi:TusA-related sulfurtransferase
MAPRFYSKEWLEAVIAKANSDKEYLKKAAKLTGAFLSVIADCPDGNDVKVWIKFDKGKVVDYEYKARQSTGDLRHL